ncbi:MAG: NADH-quinone oxidoreductase subunit C [Elusimicrobiota bacterium]
MEQVELIKKKLGKKILKIKSPNKKRIYMDISPEALRPAADFLFNSLKCRFSTASGIDEKDWFEVIYHFSLDLKGVFINLRVKTDKKRPQVDTISDIIKGARWIERELHELMNVSFSGNEDMRPLLLSDDYKGPDNPLRKK